MPIFSPVFMPVLRQLFMPDRLAGIRGAIGRVAGVTLAATMLAACSSSDLGSTIFADPGKYQYHNCTQIAAEIKSWSHREQELKDLMDKAEQSAGGAAVGFIAYRADYINASEELDQLHFAARSKNCAPDEAWRSSTAIR
jgi:hypothetical protein